MKGKMLDKLLNRALGTCLDIHPKPTSIIILLTKAEIIYKQLHQQKTLLNNSTFLKKCIFSWFYS